MNHIILEERVNQLEFELEAKVKELEEAKLRIKELELQLSKKMKMPKGGNTHKVPNSSILFKCSLRTFMDKVEVKKNINGKEYKDWKKAMQYAKSDSYIQDYAKKYNVQITQRNLERWYKHYFGIERLNSK
ncbi:MAG: hypothetical protein MSH12_12750 [Romboutsia timonensis]|nr:hypothetical protein [Romboutsia timonensis]